MILLVFSFFFTILFSIVRDHWDNWEIEYNKWNKMFCEINEYGDLLIATKSHIWVLIIIDEFLWQFYILTAKICQHILCDYSYQVQINSLPDRFVIQSLFRFILSFKVNFLRLCSVGVGNKVYCGSVIFWFYAAWFFFYWKVLSLKENVYLQHSLKQIYWIMATIFGSKIAMQNLT